jgi:hypothetical protein
MEAKQRQQKQTKFDDATKKEEERIIIKNEKATNKKNLPFFFFRHTLSLTHRILCLGLFVSLLDLAQVQLAHVRLVDLRVCRLLAAG